MPRAERRNPAFNSRWSPESRFQRLDEPGAPIDRIFAEADETRFPRDLPILSSPSLTRSSKGRTMGRGSNSTDSGRHIADN